jgi:hypothetical protein
MDTFSSVVIAIVFLSGASTGALLTAVYRYAVRERIQRDFQSRLADVIAARDRSDPTDRNPTNSAVLWPTSVAPSTQEPEDAGDVADVSWIAADTGEPRSDGLRL